ncbi:kelch repeat superfamily protein [Klebsormidium nitens]|uniref:Kelch repeat superfamily protein n=1 Tax=Klebsormidium nitens TaxID=105231 RepID=A0A1Y1IJE4_KLENI|nr:kelch repeat superfamily protein [Klebsormidium nitens]|eukprot:GAQ88248.1 kelch repeat superfamily protein [Klebsormidium nitens]
MGHQDVDTLSAEWKELTQPQGAPLARSSHAVAVIGSKAYVFGGEHKPRVPIDNSLHVFDLNQQAWYVEIAKGTAPPARLGVTLVAVGKTLFIFGGRNGDKNELSNLYAFNTAAGEWRDLTDLPGAPAGRSYHAAVADEKRKSFFVFGGCAADGRRNDLYEFDTRAEAWTSYPTSAELLPRGGPGLAVVREKVYVLFGFSGKEQGDIHAFDLKSQTWQQLETSGETPTPRSVLGVTSFNDRYIVAFGGESDPSDKGHEGAGAFSDEVFILDTTSLRWSRPELRTEVGAKPPCARGWFAFAPIGRSMFIYGGNSETNERLDDLHLLTVGTA